MSQICCEIAAMAGMALGFLNSSVIKAPRVAAARLET
jgi:hypothetical protein